MSDGGAKISSEIELQAVPSNGTAGADWKKENKVDKRPSNTLTDDGSEWRDASIDLAASIRSSEVDDWTISGSVTEHSFSPVSPTPRHVQFETMTMEEAPSTAPITSNIKKRESLPRRMSSFSGSTCFRDGIRQIDFVLAYDMEKGNNQRQEMAMRKALYRLRFEALLKNRGLQLENETSTDQKTAFVKVHAPFSVLQRQAELQRMRKPFMECDIEDGPGGWWTRIGEKICCKNAFELQDEYKLPETDYFSDAFERDRKNEFLFHDDELAFFTSAQRAFLTWDIISNVAVRLEDEDKSIFLLHMFSPVVGERRRERSQRGEQGEEEERKISNGVTGRRYDRYRGRFGNENAYENSEMKNGQDYEGKVQQGQVDQEDDGDKWNHQVQVDQRVQRDRRDHSGLVDQENQGGLEDQEDLKGHWNLNDQGDLKHQQEDKEEQNDQRDDKGDEGTHKEEETQEEKEEEEDEEEEEQEEEEEEDEEKKELDEQKEDTQGRRASFRFLLSMGVYSAAYPLHDSDLNNEEQLKDIPPCQWPMRKYLHETWARPRQWRRSQPLGAIRDYYGEKMALYFAFIGFYTKMLIAPSIVGLIVTLYGLVSMPFDDNAQAICGNERVGNTLLCPDCPVPACTYTRIKNFCTSARIAGIFDSEATIFFSIFMALWAVCFLEFWKRYSSELLVAWDMASDEYDEENVRPEYLLRAPHVRLNPVTMRVEPHVKISSKLKRIAASVGTVLFFLLIVMGFLASTVVYKRIGPTLWQKWLRAVGKVDEDGKEYSLAVSFTSAVANGLFIIILSPVYNRVAWFLTKAEFPRTDRDFESSYTHKIFAFQCINYYGFLFWLAIVKGRDSHPPHMDTGYGVPCPVTGCLVDVTIQLAVIFTGKQLLNQLIELGKPLVLYLWKIRKCGCKNTSSDESIKSALPSWQRDFNLIRNEAVLLFSDYLELLIQYGFVTMFVAAFPLAPLFAFLNNVFEIRLDAYKIVVLTQRCVPFRSNNLGAWYRLLTVITKLAVLINALVIAFTTKFVDRLVYNLFDGNQNATDTAPGLFHSLSLFRTSDWDSADRNRSLSGNDTDYCYYVDYRHPPDDPIHPYHKTPVWWHVLAAKLLFIILFEHFVMLFQYLLSYAIPDVPKGVKVRIAREKYLLRVSFLRREFGDKAKNNEDDDDGDDEDKPFIPDELPDWLTTGNGDTRTIQTEDEDLEEGKVRRGKIMQTNVRRKRPFLLVLFRKLMICD